MARSGTQSMVVGKCVFIQTEYIYNNNLHIPFLYLTVGQVTVFSTMYVLWLSRSDKTVYAKQNGGDYEFVIESFHHKAMPTEQVVEIFMF